MIIFLIKINNSNNDMEIFETLNTGIKKEVIIPMFHVRMGEEKEGLRELRANLS